MESLEASFFDALRASGMSAAPDGFSVALVAQEISAVELGEIDEFIRVFDRVTSRTSWQEGVTSSAPEFVRHHRPEVCFFSAWDFHVPAEAPERWQLIEFNDNGSGFLFAAMINHYFHELSGLRNRGGVEPPPTLSAFNERLLTMIEGESVFFGGATPALFLILDDAESLANGKFRDELVLLRDLLRRRGRHAELATPEALSWSGRDLLFQNRTVSFVVNRSTDFLWESEPFSALKAGYRAGRVYVAPNPFTYATRSDKRLLVPLSSSDRDAELGVRPDERPVLSAHVPETRLVSEENVEELVLHKQELCFKPAHGYASRGLLPSAQVGRRRLRRLLRKGVEYVAQRRVPKARLAIPGVGDNGDLWADLRVWAYRGERYLISGRGSRRPDVLDLHSPGGWLPTYATSAQSPGTW